MPAAIVWNASLPEQASGPARSASLPAPDAMRPIEAPGTIVVGEVVALRDWLTTTATGWQAPGGGVSWLIAR